MKAKAERQGPSVSAEVRRLTQRAQKPKKPPQPEASAEVPHAPAAAAPAPYPWATLAPIWAEHFGPIYDALEVPRPTTAQWELFCTSWGAVVDWYLPVLAATPWPGACLATVSVFGPLAMAAVRRRRHAQRRPSVTAVQAEGAGRDGPEPTPWPQTAL